MKIESQSIAPWVSDQVPYVWRSNKSCRAERSVSVKYLRVSYVLLSDINVQLVLSVLILMYYYTIADKSTLAINSSYGTQQTAYHAHNRSYP